MSALGWIKRRPLLALLSALVLAMVGLQVVERLVNGPGQPWTPPERDEEESRFLHPAVERVDENMILIDAGIIDQSRFRFGSGEPVEYVDALQACFTGEIERDFTVNPTESRREMRTRLKRITRECLETTATGGD